MTLDYDRIYGMLKDVSPMSRPSTVREALPMVGAVTTWVVQTAMHESGSVVFLEALSADGQIRIVLPAKVTQAIIRQDKNLRAHVSDRRSKARKEADLERQKVRAARALLERKREERRARRGQTA